MDRGAWRATVYGVAEALPFPSPGDLHNPGIEPTSSASPTLAGRFLKTESLGKLIL